MSDMSRYKANYKGVGGKAYSISFYITYKNEDKNEEVEKELSEEEKMDFIFDIADNLFEEKLKMKDYQKIAEVANYNKEKITELEKHEKELLEKKSEVLRRYLAENVIPVLSKGILHVCQTLPDDPVDELAFYLFDNAFNAKFPPHKYKDQQ